MQRLIKGGFAIETQENSGFFSVMQMILFILMYCAEKGMTQRISARGGIYGDPLGEMDWFSAYFETVRTPTEAASTQKVRTSTVRDLVQLGLRQRYETRLQLKSASDLFLSHYRPAAHIADEVSSICKRLEISKSTLGAHFRGTNKKLKPIPVSRQKSSQLVESVLEQNPT